MRKLTVSVKPNILMRKAFGKIFDKIQTVELRELLRVDFAKGLKIGVGDITLNPGYDIHNLKLRRMRILDILDQKEDTYTCLVKVNVPKTSQKILKLFDFDLIYDIPTKLSKQLLTYSVIGDEKHLKKFLTLVKLIGSVQKVIFKRADYRGVGITQSLTKRQNHILQEAMSWGYYQYPRKIDTKELALRVGVSRTTLVEHLRKAENRVMEKVLVK